MSSVTVLFLNRIRSLSAWSARLVLLPAVAFFCSGPLEVRSAADLDWRAARNVPYQIRDGLELARNRADKAFASLSLICSSEGETHLLLLTRLPGQEGFRRDAPGRDDEVSLFVEGISHMMPIVVDVVAIGESNTPETSGKLDTIVTPPLPRDAMVTLSDWFGHSPPTKVSVVGIDETGVFMVGTRDGLAVQDFDETCASSR
jgi:hypothetical protein